MADVMKHVAGECPDLETIAACLDGRLSDRERARITEHLAVCEHCYTLFNESAQTHVAAEPARSPIVERWRAWVTVPRLAWSSAGAALATAACLWLLVGSGLIMRSPQSKSELQALVAAVGTDRTIEGRLTGGFAYGPVRGVVRAGEPSSVTASPDVRIAVAQIEKEATAHRTPAALRSLGVAYLVVGDVNRAVLALEEAADGTTPDAQILSDLSAAYLTRATRNHQPQDFAKAVTMADRGVRADARAAEAWFNRACALERLSLSDEARQAWQDYLKVDDNSGWAEEARNRIRTIVDSPQSESLDEERRAFALAASGSSSALSLAAVVKRSPDAARSWLEAQLLVEWPRLALNGNAEEARSLVSRMQPVADALLHERDDAFLRDAVASVVKARSRGNDIEHALANAHQLYQAAAEAYDADRIADSANLIARAIEPLDRAGSAFAVAARRYRAIGAYYANDFPAALVEIHGVAAYAESHRYTRLLGLAHRLAGLVSVVRGDYGTALDAYQAALICFQSIGDVEDEAAIQSALAEAFAFVGDTQQSWLARYAALSLIGSVREPIAKYRILQGASLSTLREELPEAALHLQQAALESAQRAGRAPAVITGYLNRAAINDRLGQSRSATTDLQDARRFLATVDDPLLVARNQARILLARGETLAREHPAEAIGDLDQALVYLERTRTSWPLASVYLARGRAHLAAHQQKLAEADFLSGIQVFERLRSELTSEDLRMSYFEQPWDLFTEMIRLQADHNDAGRALMFAERARARTLLEAVDDRAGRAQLAASDATNVLPPGVAVVYYASLDERLLIWLITRNSQQFVSTSTRQTDVARLVERWRSAFGAADQASTLMALYDLLIRPIERSLPDRASLAIVPDGVLHAVPFAALIRRENSRHLVEDHALETTPSLTILERSINPRRPAAAALTSALVIGNPRVESGATPALPEAEREAREIATLYPRSRLLVDADASKARFMTLAAGYDVVHFAGHGVSNDDYPSLSRLLLAGTDESDRSLFAHEISAMHLERTALVVLAACRTSAGRLRRGEGVLSLARPFIAAGVPTVVASLWDVDDRASHSLFVAFHHALRRGLSIAEALRDAQLAAMAESDPVLRDPANWANFVVIGGAAAFGYGPSATMR